jgi:hypothetical protein
MDMLAQNSNKREHPFHVIKHPLHVMEHPFHVIDLPGLLKQQGHCAVWAVHEKTGSAQTVQAAL